MSSCGTTGQCEKFTRCNTRNVKSFNVWQCSSWYRVWLPVNLASCVCRQRGQWTMTFGWHKPRSQILNYERLNEWLHPAGFWSEVWKPSLDILLRSVLCRDVGLPTLITSTDHWPLTTAGQLLLLIMMMMLMIMLQYYRRVVIHSKTYRYRITACQYTAIFLAVTNEGLYWQTYAKNCSCSTAL